MNTKPMTEAEIEKCLKELRYKNMDAQRQKAQRLNNRRNKIKTYKKKIKQKIYLEKYDSNKVIEEVYNENGIVVGYKEKYYRDKKHIKQKAKHDKYKNDVVMLIE